MKINRKVISVVVVVGTLLITLALAVSGHGQQGRGGQPPGGGFPGGPGRDGLRPITRDLNLSEEQKAQIQKITESFRENTTAFQDQLRTLHDSEPDPLTSGFDEAAVRAAADARAKVEVELSVARAKMLSQIGAVLTSEQKAQIEAKRQGASQRRRSFQG
jgi:Spy/CpxP family protein refolding chaperone